MDYGHEFEPSLGNGKCAELNFTMQMKRMLHNVQQPGNVQRVLKLQLEAFWQRHSRAILALGAVLLVYSLW